MELEKQVASLDLSKKLKELGVKQKSIFYWTYDHRGPNTENNDDRSWELEYIENPKQELEGVENCSAFTVAELGEMLPNHAHSWHVPEGEWYCSWKKLPNGHPSFIADTEADARAKMLIYLLENRLLQLS